MVEYRSGKMLVTHTVDEKELTLVEYPKKLFVMYWGPIDDTARQELRHKSGRKMNYQSAMKYYLQAVKGIKNLKFSKLNGSNIG